MKVMKNLRFHERFLNIMKIIKSNAKTHESNESLIITFENHEHFENPRIPIENHANNENLKILCENH